MQLFNVAFILILHDKKIASVAEQHHFHAAPAPGEIF
jgi:hypothetical protein